MTEDQESKYNLIRDGGTGFYETKRGLIAVWGGEAVRFLDGLITNDMKTLEDGALMLAAFPNAHGRLLAVVRVLRQGDRFLFETEEATREKLFQNLFRFTFAGDFFVEDLSEKYRYFEVIGPVTPVTGAVVYASPTFSDFFVVSGAADAVRADLISNGVVEISKDLHETFRLESGTPKYGVDMDETTIVPEIGIDALISYNKGCYIGQEIIARIHFRGHVAKKLTGLILSTLPASSGGSGGVTSGLELSTLDGKNAGRITSVTFSPKLDRHIALAYVRYDYMAAGTELTAGNSPAVVTDLPFIA